MADTKITALAENTTPILTDVLPMVDDPGGSPITKKVTVKNIIDLSGGYVLEGGGTKFSPADNVIYYFGSSLDIAPSTNADLKRMYIPKAGTIVYVGVYIYTAGTNSSAENSTMALRLNNTSDTTISSTVTLGNDAVYVSAVVSIAVVAGDYIEFKWTQPANWTTNPTNVYVTGWVFIQ